MITQRSNLPFAQEEHFPWATPSFVVTSRVNDSLCVLLPLPLADLELFARLGDAAHGLRLGHLCPLHLELILGRGQGFEPLPGCGQAPLQLQEESLSLLGSLLFRHVLATLLSVHTAVIVVVVFTFVERARYPLFPVLDALGKNNLLGLLARGAVHLIVKEIILIIHVHIRRVDDLGLEAAAHAHDALLEGADLFRGRVADGTHVAHVLGLEQAHLVDREGAVAAVAVDGAVPPAALAEHALRPLAGHHAEEELILVALGRLGAQGLERLLFAVVVLFSEFAVLCK